jgi:peroxiredoxin
MKLTNPVFKFTRSVRLAVATVGLLTLFVFTPSASFQTEALVRIGSRPKAAVANLKLATLDGQYFSLAALRGKVVVLDFFSLRCLHSHDHIKDTMIPVWAEQGNEDLQIIGLESESASADAVRQFVRSLRITYPVAQIDESAFIQFVNSRDLSSPQTIVFGRDGKVVLHTIGSSAQNEAAIRAAVRKALNKN